MSALNLRGRIIELEGIFGSLRAVAKATRIDVGYLSRLKAGEKSAPSAATLKRLGMRKIVAYVRIDAPPARGAP